MTSSDSDADTRAPLAVALAIADRFLRIPPNEDYMYGVGMGAILDLYAATREPQYLDRYLAWAHPKGPGLDFELHQVTGDDRWLAGAREQGERFLANPRRDRDGSLLDPRGRYTIDLLSWYLPQAARFGQVLQDGRFFDEAERLFEIHRGYLEDPATGVWYSRWGHALHPHRPNPGLWGRGNGWLVAAWSRVMHRWDHQHPTYPRMLAAWQRYCRDLAAWQAPSGLFRQLLNRPDCFEEASASGLFCAGFARSVLHGTLPAAFGVMAERTFAGLRALTDDEGNLHNVSTYAGGYNFERQYYTCARWNEPHGDGTVLGGCVALHQLHAAAGKAPAPLPALAPPVIITAATPGLLTVPPPVRRTARDIAPPVLARALRLTALPEHDRDGNTILGLLQWYDYSRNEAARQQAQRLLEVSGPHLAALVRGRLTAELGARTGQPDDAGLLAFVAESLRTQPRDRHGTFLDDAGGYSVGTLYTWLPLLARAGAAGAMGCFDEAWLQFSEHRQWLEDPLTRLWYSAWGRGAHPRRVTPGLWALGNGYCLASVLDLLEHLPPRHPQYLELLLFLRGYVAALHEYLPVYGGNYQLMDDVRSFRCVAATALIAAGTNRAVSRGWVLPEYYGVAYGGIWLLGELVDARGHWAWASRPEGGRDSAAAYATHRLRDDDSALGFILAACAQGAVCETAPNGWDNRDQRLGAQ